MIRHYFLSEEFYGSFKTAFLKKYKFSQIAEDAFSFAYEKFLLKLKTSVFENERRAYAYLWKVAERKLLRELIRASRYTRFSSGFDRAAEEDHSIEKNNFIEQMIVTLSKKNRKVIEMLHEGMKIGEIAEKLSEKKDTIRHRINRSTKKITMDKNF